jgi:hypothetical protein
MVSYMGMTYEQASREAARLIHKAHSTANWWKLPEKLIDLRAIMKRYEADELRRELRKAA